MANNPDLAFAGAKGKGYVAARGTTAPTGNPVTDPLPADYTAGDLGMCTTDGLEAGVDEDRQDFEAWGYLGPTSTQITKRTRTFVIAPLEANPTVLGLYDGVATPTADDEGVMAYALTDDPDPDIRGWVFDTMQGGKWIRYYVPSGEITARENLTYKPDEQAAYKFTVTAYPGSDGVSVYKTVVMPSLAG